MKKTLEYIKSFANRYTTSFWLSITVFSVVSLFLNYYYDVNSYMFNQEFSIMFLMFFALYAFHIILPYWLLKVLNPKLNIQLSMPLIALLLMSCLVFSFRSAFIGHKDWIELMSNNGYIRLNQLIYNNIFRFLYLVLPLLLVWLIYRKKDSQFYGFSLQNHHFKIYFIFLLVMLPLIFGASFLSDFLEYYPRAKKLMYYNPSVSDVLLYELFYGLDFISIEVFFRGFLVIGLIHLVGIDSIIPMAVFYLSIHFGKPIGESISSFFGGTLLGLMAFHTRSIIGGIMVHVGIAWLMELGAFLGNWLKGG